MFGGVLFLFLGGLKIGLCLPRLEMVGGGRGDVEILSTVMNGWSFWVLAMPGFLRFWLV
jgi:hypothetical protein